MRVLLIGPEPERRHLRKVLEESGVENIAEAEEGHEKPTPREQEVLELLVLGYSNKRIASRLGISEHTVKFHVAAICGKLGAENRTDAVRRAVLQGLVAL